MKPIETAYNLATEYKAANPRGWTLEKALAHVTANGIEENPSTRYATFYALHGWPLYGWMDDDMKRAITSAYQVVCGHKVNYITISNDCGTVHIERNVVGIEIDTVERIYHPTPASLRRLAATIANNPRKPSIIPTGYGITYCYRY